MSIDIGDVARLIPVGYENAKTLPEMVQIYKANGFFDNNIVSLERQTRRILARVGIDYVVCNLQDGKGYFRPTKEDLSELRKWVNQEERRAKEIGKRIHKGKRLLEDFYKERCNEQRLD